MSGDTPCALKLLGNRKNQLLPEVALTRRAGRIVHCGDSGVMVPVVLQGEMTVQDEEQIPTGQPGINPVGATVAQLVGDDNAADAARYTGA